MPVFMDDVAAIGKADSTRKGIQNCRRMEIKKKNTIIITMNYSYKKDNAVTKCPLSKKSEDITMHVLGFEEAIKFTLILLKKIAKKYWKK